MREMVYYQCPFCGWCRPEKYGGREVRFDKIDPEKVRVLQTRQLSGGISGQPKGGHITIVDSKTISELPDNIKNQIRNQTEKILKALS